jgi:hydroxymethylglutaryl-CoA lyase
MKASAVKLIECPRDAMQGWREWIPTEKKKAYLEALLRVGFDTIDCGSFVSANAIPQMADTPSLMGSIDKKGSDTRLLVIVANVRGAKDAIQFPAVDYIGYPLSVSETFQQKNTNASIAESLQRLREMQALCSGAGKQMVVYISMAFGNPYGDAYDESVVISFAEKIASEGIGIISLADTVGLATPDQVHRITSKVIQALPQVEVGVHLHSGPYNREAKISAAYDAGCRRFDGALLGIGGCPMANDALVGNINTEWFVAYFDKMGVLPPLREEAWREAMSLANEIFLLPLEEH